MARRLTGLSNAPRGRRAAAWAVLVVAVVLLHAAVTGELADRMIEFDAGGAMLARIAVTYVRTVEPAAPTPIAPRAAAPSLALAGPSSGRAPRRVQRAASAVVAAVEPASAAAADRRHADLQRQADPPAEALTARAASESMSVVPAPTGADDASAAATVASEAAGSADPGAFQWPVSTRVSYLLTGNYRGEVSGSAQVEWVRVGNRYQVNLDLVVGPDFAPIISRRMTSEGSIAASGLVPDHYDEETQVVFRERRRARVVFEADAIVLANGQRRERLTGVQDTASQFVQLAYLFATRPELLEVGNTFEFPLALPRLVDRWTYEVADSDAFLTPFGTLPAFHLKPRRPVRKNGELIAELWISPALRYLPVRIRIEQDAANFLDLTIATKPELAAP